MILDHETSNENAAAIQAESFRDTGGMTKANVAGAFLSYRPLDASEGPRDTVVAVDLPLSKADLDQYEWKEEGKGYREWLISAAVNNKYWWPK